MKTKSVLSAFLILFSLSNSIFALTASFQGLGYLPLPGGYFTSSATDVSADGSVVVGVSSSMVSGSSHYKAFRWTKENGMVGLGELTGGEYFSNATGVSADGSVIVGFRRSTSGKEAFRWTQETGMVGLGDLPGGFFSSLAFNVSGDGSIVVGYSRSAWGNENQLQM